MKNSEKVTSQTVAQTAAKVLRGKKYSAISKSLAGCALSQYSGKKKM